MASAVATILFPSSGAGTFPSLNQSLGPRWTGCSAPESFLARAGGQERLSEHQAQTCPVGRHPRTCPAGTDTLANGRFGKLLAANGHSAAPASVSPRLSMRHFVSTASLINRSHMQGCITTPVPRGMAHGCPPRHTRNGVASASASESSSPFPPMETVDRGGAPPWGKQNASHILSTQ